MTLQVAIALLGIDRGESPEKVRRAYLRHLRDHSPERDPERFRRLRDAYELLAVYSSSGWPDSRQGGVLGDPPLGEKPKAASKAPSGQHEPQVPAREGDPPAAVPATVSPSAITATLADAFRTGFPSRDAAVSAFLGAHRSITSMLEQGKVDAALSLGRAIGAWLALSDHRASGLPDGLLAQWLLLRDLLSAAPGLPPEALKPLAAGLACGEPEKAVEELSRFTRNHRARSEEAASLLEASSRALWDTVKAGFQPNPLAPSLRPRQIIGLAVVVGVVFFGVTFALRDMTKRILGPKSGSANVGSSQAKAAPDLDRFLFRAAIHNIVTIAEVRNSDELLIPAQEIKLATEGEWQCSVVLERLPRLVSAASRLSLPPYVRMDVARVQELAAGSCRGGEMQDGVASHASLGREKAP